MSRDSRTLQTICSPVEPVEFAIEVIGMEATSAPDPAAPRGTPGFSTGPHARGSQPARPCGRRLCMLLETYYPEIGGGETQARLLAEGLVERGFEVLVLTRRSGADQRGSAVVGNIPIRRVGPTGPGQLKKWGMLFTVAPALVRMRRSYDILLVAGFRILGAPAIIVGKLLGKTCILKADSNGEMSGAFFAPGLARWRLSPSSFPFRLLLQFRNAVLRRADTFVPLSSEIAGELRASGVDPRKMCAIPNCVDTDRFRPVSEEEKRRIRLQIGIPLEDTIAIFTGRLVRYKGLPLLLRVWREISRRHTGVRLLLVGGGGTDLHNCEVELKRYVASNGMEDSVVFTGFVEGVHRYLQAADAFVFPTQEEAFGIALIEAMACGLPVVTTSTGGIRDIVTHEKDALVVEPGSLDQLCEMIEKLLTDESLAARLGEEARRTASQRFSRDAIVTQYVKLLCHKAGLAQEERE